MTTISKPRSTNTEPHNNIQLRVRTPFSNPVELQFTLDSTVGEVKQRISEYCRLDNNDIYLLIFDYAGVKKYYQS